MNTIYENNLKALKQKMKIMGGILYLCEATEGKSGFYCGSEKRGSYYWVSW